MNEYRIRRAKLVAGEMTVPGDFAISLRALTVAALANGPSLLRGFLPAVECMELVQGLQSLGVRFDYLSSRDPDRPWDPPADETAPPGPSCLRVHGMSGKFQAPSAAVSAGGSVHAARFLLAVVATRAFASRMMIPATGGMEELAAGLKQLGADLRPQTGGIECGVSAKLGGAEIKAALRNPANRDAVLLAAMLLPGKTTLTDAVPGPQHLENVLRHFQVKTLREQLRVSIWGGQTPESRDMSIPGDISCAAPFIMAAAVQPGSSLTVRDVGLSAARTGFLRVLVRMGAQVREEVRPARGGGETVGSVVVRGALLRRTDIAAPEAAALGDELPALLVTAAQAEGDTSIKYPPGGREQLSPTLELLERIGVKVVPQTDGVTICGTGGEPFDHAEHDSRGVPALAAAAALAGLCGSGETLVRNAACLESRWHGFHRQLERFQSREISEGLITPMLHIVTRSGKRSPQRPGGASGNREKRP